MIHTKYVLCVDNNDLTLTYKTFDEKDSSSQSLGLKISSKKCPNVFGLMAPKKSVFPCYKLRIEHG